MKDGFLRIAKILPLSVLVFVVLFVMYILLPLPLPKPFYVQVDGGLDLFGWFHPEETPWWMWLIMGVVLGVGLWFTINTFILPDPWSVALAQRKNGWVALVPLGLTLLTAGLVPLLLGFIMAVVDAIFHLQVQAWVWVVIVVGLVLVKPGWEAFSQLVKDLWRRI